MEYRNQVIYGDALEVLERLPDGVVQVCVTSPPYWGLRDYGVEGQLGLEATPEEYVERLVEIMREVRRVLRADGTLWLNLGDSYATQGGAGRQGENGQRATRTFTAEGSSAKGVPSGLKPKDLCGMPWRVAFALQADGAADPREMRRVEELIAAIESSYDSLGDVPAPIRREVARLREVYEQANEGGWWLRSDIIWAKPNPMPESVTDRPTGSHEYLFLLTKSARYFYDADAIREGLTESSRSRLAQDVENQAGTERAHGGAKTSGPLKAVGDPVAGRNKRSVWQIATKSFLGAHFATFPPALVEPCVLAGSSPQACSECGAPWERVVKKGEPDEEWKARCGADSSGEYHGVAVKDYESAGAENAAEVKARILEGMRERVTTGWRATCSCENDGSGRCVVLDPFAGSGTTGEVAMGHGRDYLLIELNRDYEPLIQKRLGLFYQSASGPGDAHDRSEQDDTSRVCDPVGPRRKASGTITGRIKLAPTVGR